jgi:predicted Zn-dependent protease
MKKRLVTTLTLMIFILSTAFVFASQGIKYVESKFDVYGIRFRRPADWKCEVRAEVCIITNPADKNVELVYLEDNVEYNGSLEDYLNLYKTEWVDQKTMKVLSERPIEIAGLGAYYVRVDTGEKQVGHVLFLRNKKVFALGLKTGRNSYDRYEPVLMEVVKSFRFMNNR